MRIARHVGRFGKSRLHQRSGRPYHFGAHAHVRSAIMLRVVLGALLCVCLSGCFLFPTPMPHARVLQGAFSADGSQLALLVHRYTKTDPDTPFYVPEDKVDHVLELVLFDTADLPAEGVLNWDGTGSVIATVEQDPTMAGTDAYDAFYWQTGSTVAIGATGTASGADAIGPWIWRTGETKTYLPRPTAQEFTGVTLVPANSGWTVSDIVEFYDYQDGSVVLSPDGASAAVIWSAGYGPNRDLPLLTYANEVVAFYSIPTSGTPTLQNLQRITEAPPATPAHDVPGDGAGLPIEPATQSLSPYDVLTQPFYRLLWNTHPSHTSLQGVYAFASVSDVSVPQSAERVASWFVPADADAADVSGAAGLSYGSRGEFVSKVPAGRLPGPSGRISQSEQAASHGRALDIEIPRVTHPDLGMEIDGDETILKLRQVTGWNGWSEGAFGAL